MNKQDVTNKDAQISGAASHSIIMHNTQYTDHLHEMSQASMKLLTHSSEMGQQELKYSADGVTYLLSHGLPRFNATFFQQTNIWIILAELQPSGPSNNQLS